MLFNKHFTWAMLLQEFNAGLGHSYFKSIKNLCDAIQ